MITRTTNQTVRNPFSASQTEAFVRSSLKFCILTHLGNSIFRVPFRTPSLLRRGKLPGGPETGTKFKAFRMGTARLRLGQHLYGRTDDAGRADQRRLFWAYVRRVLIPMLRPGDVVIMDNLSSHKRVSVREMTQAAGARLIFLPPYGLDFTPIELAFAKLKALLRKAAEQTMDGFLKQDWSGRRLLHATGMRELRRR